MTDVVYKKFAMSNGNGVAYLQNEVMSRAVYDMKPEPSDFVQTVGRGAAALRSIFAAIFEIFLAPLFAMTERHLAFSRLMALDDRMLEDIGMGRGDIAPAVFGEKSGLVALAKTWIGKAQDALAKRRAIQSLRKLPDHLLHDIGVERADIEAVVLEGARKEKRFVRQFARPLAPWTYDKAVFDNKADKLAA